MMAPARREQHGRPSFSGNGAFLTDTQSSSTRTRRSSRSLFCRFSVVSRKCSMTASATDQPCTSVSLLTPIEGNEDVTFCLKAINTGGVIGNEGPLHLDAAIELDDDPGAGRVPAAKDNPRCFSFSMKADDVIGAGLVGWHKHPLGWIELTYCAGWGLWRQAKTAIYLGESPDMPVRLGKCQAPRGATTSFRSRTGTRNGSGIRTSKTSLATCNAPESFLRREALRCSCSFPMRAFADC